jgi:transposase
MDNARFHHGREVQHWAALNQIRIEYLPPYSPQLNPIENIFAVAKARLDTQRPRPTNFEELQQALDQAFEHFRGLDLSSYYRQMRAHIQMGLNREIFI